MKPFDRHFPAPLTLLLLLAPLASSQETEKPEPVPLPPSPFEQQDSEQGALQKELSELFIKVENNLKKIDGQLADAGAGEVSLEEVSDAGLDDLLRSVQDKGNQTKTQIDRILEIAQELDQKGSGGGSGSSKKPSKPPEQGGQGQQKEENTPEAQKPQDEQGKEQPKGDDPKSPESDQPSDEKGGENIPSGPPQDGSTGPSQRAIDADKWGFLPERQRKTFRNQGRDDLPVQYRQWIDAYYRRLNKETK